MGCSMYRNEGLFNSELFDWFECVRKTEFVPESTDKALERYLKSGSNHISYKHYGSQRRISSILNNMTLYLSDGSEWNDKVDGSRFNSASDRLKRFGICFSWSQSESIAMWMLYGGRGKDGAMIDFTSQAIQPPINGRIALGHFINGETFKTVLELPVHEIQFSLIDVLYVDMNNRRNSEKVLKLRPSGQNSYIALANSLTDSLPQSVIKSKAWEYEQEVRLIASVSKSALGSYVSAITHLKFPLDPLAVERKVKVYRSPLCNAPENYRPSALTGTVDWDLCKGCDEKSK